MEDWQRFFDTYRDVPEPNKKVGDSDETEAKSTEQKANFDLGDAGEDIDEDFDICDEVLEEEHSSTNACSTSVDSLLTNTNANTYADNGNYGGYSTQKTKFPTSDLQKTRYSIKA